MASAEKTSEPITGVWVGAPNGVQRQSPRWSRGGQIPQKLKSQNLTTSCNYREYNKFTTEI